MKVGYLRVSTIDQSLARQQGVLEVDKVFEEKASAGSTDRPVLRECLSFLREGDELHVVSIDRLARNLADLQKIVTSLTDKGVTVCFKREVLTFDGNGDNPMSTLMLQMLGAFSQFERSLIRERQLAGIEKAHKRGVKFGRPPKLVPEVIAKVHKLCAEQGSHKGIIAESLGISRPALYRALKMEVTI